MPIETLDQLIEGNKRFAAHNALHPNRDEEARSSLLKTQKPFAAIVACSDSRVPVEIIFDAGLGDLFVIRAAGQVLSKEALGSLDYAVSSLGVKVIMVLGHENCGAIDSAIKNYNVSCCCHIPPNLRSVLEHIYPIFDNKEIIENDENFYEHAIDLNIHYQLDYLLKNDRFLAEKIKSKEISLVGAKYDLKSGLVNILTNSQDGINDLANSHR